MSIAAKRKELDSLFVLRHAQRCDKVASTISSIDFVQSNHHMRSAGNGYTIGDTYNPGLATFESTGNKSNNGYTQSMEMGRKILSYIQEHVEETIVALKLHTSPYLRCLETVKLVIDYIIRKHRDDKLIKIELNISQVLSEWLNNELDINYFPPNDNGATLLSTAIQYLNSNIPFNKNENVKIFLNLNDSYKHGNPGPYSESFLQHYTRLSNGLISIIKEDSSNLSKEADSKDIVLLMTHGACVRSLVSKILGKSLYLEIPLASVTLAKPTFQDQKHYFWRLVETDIELKPLLSFQQVDIYSNRDPFRDIQTTFNHKNPSSQLNFKSSVNESPSKTNNLNRFRSQSLLSSKNLSSSSNNSDSDSDSDNEGISFQARSRRQTISSDEAKGRLRSTSLFTPVIRNSFFDSGPSSRRPSRENLNNNNNGNLLLRNRSIERGLIRNTSFVSTNSNQLNLSRLDSNDQELKISTSTASLMSLNSLANSPLQQYINIDEDDGIYELDHHNDSQYVPELQLSSNNSSFNSFQEEVSKGTPDSDNLIDHKRSTSSIITITHPPKQEPLLSEIDQFSNEPSTSSKITFNGESSSQYDNKSRIFDKELIEKGLNTVSADSEIDSKPHNNNWFSFHSQPESKKEEPRQDRFKIDLYEKRNKYKLNLYGTDDNNSGTESWFLGSNK